jgi:hypothetical protein
VADLGHRFVELGLAPPGDEDERAFLDEAPCRCKADAAEEPGSAAFLG